MRRWVATCIALASVAVIAAAAGAAPVAAFEPTACQTWIWPGRISVGRNVGLSGSYTDWAEPGSITAAFRGPHGQTKTVEDVVDGSGYWEISVRFGPSETGPWTVLTTFSEPGAQTIRCTGHLVVVGPRVPDTALEGDDVGAVQPFALALLLLVGLSGLAASSGRLDGAPRD